jgi:transcriptional regulator with PAS, ATPase and Fis domain
LLQRLLGTIVQVPPLRNRREDIPPLVDHFLDDFAKRLNQPRPTLARDGLALLMAYSWPGNVRELKQLLGTAILYQNADRVIPASAIENELRTRERRQTATAQFEGSLRMQVQQFEEIVIRRVLAEHDNNVTATARALDMSRQHLYKKLSDYGISHG